MKINFEGSIHEFQALFSGAVLYRLDDEDGIEDDDDTLDLQAAALQILDGGRKEKAKAESEEAPQSVSINPLVSSLPVPKNSSNAGKKLELPKLAEEERSLGWRKFKEVCVLWIENFNKTEEVEVEVMRPLRDADEGYLVDEKGNRVPSGKQAVHVACKEVQTRPAQPQPDRLGALRELGSGRYPRPVLVMAYEIGSLQRMVEKALLEAQPDAVIHSWDLGVLDAPNDDPRHVEWLSFIDHVAMNMVQVSHMAFPDLAGTYDYSTRWKREGSSSAV